MNRIATIQLGAASLVALLAMTTPSFAYLDPGTASIALQAIVAALAAGSVTAGIYWNKVKALFVGRRATETKKGDK